MLKGYEAASQATNKSVETSFSDNDGVPVRTNRSAPDPVKQGRPASHQSGPLPQNDAKTAGSGYESDDGEHESIRSKAGSAC